MRMMTTPNDLDFEILEIAERSIVYKSKDITEIGDVHLQHMRYYAKRKLDKKEVAVRKKEHKRVYDATNKEIKRRFLTGKLISIPDEKITPNEESNSLAERPF